MCIYVCHLMSKINLRTNQVSHYEKLPCFHTRFYSILCVFFSKTNNLTNLLLKINKGNKKKYLTKSNQYVLINVLTYLTCQSLGQIKFTTRNKTIINTHIALMINISQTVVNFSVFQFIPHTVYHFYNLLNTILLKYKNVDFNLKYFISFILFYFFVFFFF